MYHLYSIIIPCYDRREDLRHLLDSLDKQDFPRQRFEVIVADDGSSDGTEKFVDQYRKQVSYRLECCYGRREGAGKARNNGVKRARGDFFIYIDSDCVAPSHWLAEIDRVLCGEKGDAFGGPDTFHVSHSPLNKAISYSMTSFLTTGGLRGRKGKKLARFYPRSFNMGVSREIYRKIGGFGALRHGHDIEFSHRIIMSGAKVC